MKFYHFLPVMFAFVACTDQQIQYPKPLFESFTYTGNDARYDLPFNPQTHYLNPIISGTNPDPAICRKGDDFFMANSSFVYWPSIPIWHSKDLIDWDFCGYVIDRPSQVVFHDGVRIDGGVYAPDIKYCEANQTFYLIVTLVDCSGNVIFKTQDPSQGWSEPIPVPEVHGIDPSFLFDNDGKCYILNNDEPAYPAEYSGHRAIWAREYDLNIDKVCGEPVVMIDKGIRPVEKPIWIEGPHLYHFANQMEGRVYEQYYLMDAEGGTGDNHSEVVLAGKSPLGKFTPCQQNPILTQRTQPHDRPNAIACAGHADLLYVGQPVAPGVSSVNDWWSVFLATTTYDGDQLYNTGRSTFLLPASWQKDPVSGGIQPLILDPSAVIPTVCEKSEWQKTVAEAQDASARVKTGSMADPSNLLTGNGTYKDGFENKSLYPLWFTLRTPETDADALADGRWASWYKLIAGCLQLTGRSVKLSDKGQPSMLGRWVKNNSYTVEARMLFTPQENLSMGALTLFQTEEAHYIFGKRLSVSGQLELVVIKTDKEHGEQVVAHCDMDSRDNLNPIDLRAEVNQHNLQFSYSLDDGTTWNKVGDLQDADILTTNYAGGFTGCVAGLYSYKK